MGCGSLQKEERTGLRALGGGGLGEEGTPQVLTQEDREGGARLWRRGAPAGTPNLKPKQQQEKQPVHPEPQPLPVTGASSVWGLHVPPPSYSGPTGATGLGRGLEGQGDGETTFPGMGGPQTPAPARSRSPTPVTPQGTRSHDQTGSRFWTSQIPGSPARHPPTATSPRLELPLVPSGQGVIGRPPANHHHTTRWRDELGRGRGVEVWDPGLLPQPETLSTRHSGLPENRGQLRTNVSPGTWGRVGPGPCQTCLSQMRGRKRVNNGITAPTGPLQNRGLKPRTCPGPQAHPGTSDTLSPRLPAWGRGAASPPGREPGRGGLCVLGQKSLVSSGDGNQHRTVPIWALGRAPPPPPPPHKGAQA